jgi:hypothetical protein
MLLLNCLKVMAEFFFKSYIICCAYTIMKIAMEEFYCHSKQKYKINKTLNDKTIIKSVTG